MPCPPSCPTLSCSTHLPKPPAETPWSSPSAQTQLHPFWETAITSNVYIYIYILSVCITQFTITFPKLHTAVQRRTKPWCPKRVQSLHSRETFTSFTRQKVAKETREAQKQKIKTPRGISRNRKAASLTLECCLINIHGTISSWDMINERGVLNKVNPTTEPNR